MSHYRVLVVDDDPAGRCALEEVVASMGHFVECVPSAEEACAALESNAYDLVVTDLILPKMDGLGLIEWTRSRARPPASILVTGHPSLESALRAMRRGASDYLPRPFEAATLMGLIEEVLSRRPPLQIPQQSDELDGLFARSRPMKEALLRLDQAAAASAPPPILLRGETGAGKKFCATWLHRRSPRRRGPFIVLRASSMLPEQLCAELFGTKGAPGHLDRAAGGTLFIDEVETLDPQAQVGLLKLVETARYRRTDSDEELPSKVHLVLGASRELANLVNVGQFREDLFLKLSANTIQLPPLRERPEDLPGLARHFLALSCEQHRRAALTISDEAMVQLLNHSWPGNIAELKHALSQAVLLCQGYELTPDLMPRPTAHRELSGELRFRVGTAIKEIEREMIMKTLDANRGNKNRTARQLGISRRSLYNKLERYRGKQPRTL